VELAQKDGYKTSLDPYEIESRLDITYQNEPAKKVWAVG
jgi:hypothetical protein